MGHKVTVAKIDWDGLADELESIEKPQTSSSKRKLYVIGGALAIAFLFIGASFGIMISATTPSGFPTVIEPGSMTGQASYVIFRDSSTYFAKNGSTGKIDYSSSNITAVLQDTIDYLIMQNSGGTISFAVGDYVFTSGVVITQSGIEISGPTEPANWWATNLIMDGNFDLFTVDGRTIPTVWAFSMTRLNINWLSGVGDAVRLWNTSGVTFDNVGFNNIVGHAIVSDTLYGIVITHCNFWQCGVAGTKETVHFEGTGVDHLTTDVHIVHSSFQNDKYKAFLQDGGVDVTEISYCYFENCSSGIEVGPYARIVGNYFGVLQGYAILTHYWDNYIGYNNFIGGLASVYDVYVSSQRTTVEANTFHMSEAGVSALGCDGNNVDILGNMFYCGNGPAITVQNSHGSLISGNQIESNSLTIGWPSSGVNVINVFNTTITDNHFQDYAVAPTQTCGVWFSASDYNTITSNNLANMTGPWTALILTGAHNIIHDNIGYVTEASGNQSITGAVNFVMFNHGLVSIPMLVLVTPVQAGYGNWSATATATQITISFDNQPGAATWYFHWYAEV